MHGGPDTRRAKNWGSQGFSLQTGSGELPARSSAVCSHFPFYHWAGENGIICLSSVINQYRIVQATELLFFVENYYLFFI